LIQATGISGRETTAVKLGIQVFFCLGLVVLEHLIFIARVYHQLSPILCDHMSWPVEGVEVDVEHLEGSFVPWIFLVWLGIHDVD
jgi:hypothetical protein